MAAAPPWEQGESGSGGADSYLNGIRSDRLVTGLVSSGLDSTAWSQGEVTGTIEEGRTGVPLETGQVVTVTVVLVEVLVQGQSVTVTVPGSVTTMVLLPSMKVVASGQ